MIAQLKQIISESKILVHTNKKFNKNTSLKTAVVTDPYYRFGRVIEEIKPYVKQPHSSWLDLGCHHGQFLELVSKFFQLNTFGMDDWELKTELPDTDFIYFKGDLADSNWTNNFKNNLDFISALEVIEHMIDTEKFLRNCNSRLSKNGYLVISTPNINSLRNRILVPFGVYPAYLEYKNVIHHVRMFNKPKLVELLEQNGFKVLKASGVSFLPEKLLKYSLFEKISKQLSKWFPTLCGNLIIVAYKL